MRTTSLRPRGSRIPDLTVPIVVLVTALALLVVAPPAAPRSTSEVRYYLVDLGTLGGDASWGQGGLNTAGDATGLSRIPTDVNGAAFLWRESIGMAQACTLTHGLAINASRRVVGFKRGRKEGTAEAGFCDGTAMTILPSLGGVFNWATDVNDAGTIVGWSGGRAFRYANGQMTDLTSALGNPPRSEAKGINTVGHIVGEREVGSTNRAFLYNGTTVIDLGVPPGGPRGGWDWSRAEDVNNNGEVVGTITDCPVNCNPISHAFHYSNGVIRDLGALPGHEESMARAINDQGVIVGSSGSSYSGGFYGFVYRDGQMLGLNSLVDNAPGWVIGNAFDVNNAGVILADASGPAGQRAVLLVPTDQPAPPPPSAPSPLLLDNFNRANENPVSQNGNWAVVGANGMAPAQLVQNQLKNFPTPGYSYRVSPYLGGEMEAGATISSRPSNNEWLSIFVALQEAGAPTYDGYELRATMLNGTADRWEVIRITDGQQTTLATDFFEIAAGGTMFLRRGAYRLEFWWRPPGGAWQRRLGDETALADLTYRWGMIGAGGVSSGALDDFVGGSRLSLLDQYAPDLLYDTNETYRADSAAEITDNDPEGPDTNKLEDANGVVIATADSPVPEYHLRLDHLGQIYPNPSLQPSAPTDKIDESNNYATDFQRLHALDTYRNQVYGRVKTYPDGERILQYWLFYYYNPKTYFFRGAHEGDWEMVQILLDRNGVPQDFTLNQHDDGEVCDWSFALKDDYGRPKIFVAEGSHASYFRTVDGNRHGDYANGAGESVVPKVIDVTLPTNWLFWPGRWGGTPDEFLGAGSPTGPGRKGLSWDDPRAYGRSSEVDACTVAQTLALGTDVRTTSNGNVVTARPAVEVGARRIGGRVVTSFRVRNGLPTRAKPWLLLTTVDSSGTRYAPLTKRTVVRTRKGTVVQQLGLGKPPFRMHASVIDANGRRSKITTVLIR